jgi:transposase-like protein
MGKTVYNAKFKADRVLEVLAGEEQIGEIAARHNINPNMLRAWKKEFLEKSSQVFDGNRQTRELAAKEREIAVERDELLKTVGQLTIERDWLKKKSIEALGPDYEKKFSKRPY